MNDIVIRTEGVSKVYKANKVVDNVSMTIKRGDIYGFIGSNGAGKTTLIRCIMGLINCSGRIEILGKSDKAGLNEGRKKIGCIVESPALLPKVNALDCIKAHAKLYGIDDADKMKSLLALVGLDNTGDKKVRDFSLGMRQRMAIANALINDPELLILDEPTNGMDPQGIVQMRNFLIMLTQTRGVTILVSSHILAELQQLATRFGIIKQGKLVDEFSHDELEKKVRSAIAIKVSNFEQTLKLLPTALSNDAFAIQGDVITIFGDDNFNIVNRLLVKNDVEVQLLSKSQPSLEAYFINTVERAN